MDINKVILVGRLGTSPVQRQTKKGNSVVQLSVATSRKFAEQEETQWHRVVVWGKQAENCALYLKTGHSVYIEGFIRTRAYEKDDQKKHSFEVHAERVVFLTPSFRSRENEVHAIEPVAEAVDRMLDS